MQNTFQIGQVLSARFIGDHQSILSAQVISRSKSFIVISIDGETKRLKALSDAKGEFIFPLGCYSMAPIFRAPEMAVK